MNKTGLLPMADWDILAIFANICANICIFRIFLQLEENGDPRRVKDHTFSYSSEHPCLTVLNPSKMAFLISVTDPTSLSTGECQNVLGKISQENARFLSGIARIS